MSFFVIGLKNPCRTGECGFFDARHHPVQGCNVLYAESSFNPYPEVYQEDALPESMHAGAILLPAISLQRIPRGEGCAIHFACKGSEDMMVLCVLIESWCHPSISSKKVIDMFMLQMIQ